MLLLEKLVDQASGISRWKRPGHASLKMKTALARLLTTLIAVGSLRHVACAARQRHAVSRKKWPLSVYTRVFSAQE